MTQNYKLKISNVADGDLDAIYEYGFRQWGETQADRYYDDLLSHFEDLLKNPFLYASVDDIRPGYRRSLCGAHSIYYRITGEFVEIMAVIGRQDIDQHL
jgi:toxin ParE1/3/4